jgi:hypothetical protein
MIFSSARIDADRSIPICHDRPITALHPSGVVAGLEGAAVIATDAVISIAISIVKISSNDPSRIRWTPALFR